jgi:hypothetical protein
MEQTEIEDKINKEIGSLMQFCKSNQEALDRLCKIKYLTRDLKKQGIQKSIDVLTLLHNYCVETKAMAGRSILDDFDTKITQELQKLNQYVKKK